MRSSRPHWILALGLAAVLLSELAGAGPAPVPASPVPPGGSVIALAADPFHPGRVLLGTTTGTVFASTDAGAAWRWLGRVALHDDWVVAALVPDPAQAGRWYAALWDWGGAGGGVYVSSDGGVRWQPLLDGHGVRALTLAPSAPQTLVAGADDGVYRSQDGGQHWTRISPAGDPELAHIESVAVDPDNPAEIYVGTWHLPWKTVNGGHDWWQMRQGIIDDSDVFSIAVDRHHPDTIYLSACSGIYRSTDKGNQFEKIQGIPYSARRTPALVQDPADPNTVYAGTTQGLWATHDAGDTWTRITAPALRVNAVLPLPPDPASGSAAGSSRRILIGTDFAGVFASSDAGASFQPSDAGFANRHVSAVAFSPAGRYVAVTGDLTWGGVFFQADADASWRQLPALPHGDDAYGLHWSPTGLLAATGRGIYLLPAGAGAWRQPATAPRGRVHALAGPNPEAATVWAAADSGLYRSADGGLSWAALRAAPAPLYQLLALPPDVGVLSQKCPTFSERAGCDVSPRNVAPLESENPNQALTQDTSSIRGSSWLFVAGAGFVLRSPDGGRHFIAGRLGLDAAGPQPAALIQQLAAAPLPQGGELILAATSRGLYRSADLGATWTLCGHGLPAASIRALQVQPDAIYALAATVGQTYRSRDGGMDWTPVRLGAEQESEARSGPGALTSWSVPASAPL